MVAITGQVFTHLMGNDAFQECDVIGVTRPVCKHSYLIKSADEVADVVAEAFHIAHEREYVRRFPDSDIQIVNIRVQGVGLISELRFKDIPVGSADAKDALTSTLDVTFNADGKPKKLSTAFYDRTRLKAGNVITGPAIIEQLDSTVVVNPGLSAEVDQYGTLIIACE